MGDASGAALGKIAVAIPAWEPASSLIQFVSSMLALSFGSIIVVDDGSGAVFDWIFDTIARNARVHVLRHPANLGKGRALKSAFRHLLDHPADFAGVVTCDADGQHDPSDICAVAGRLAAEPDKLILGARSFCGPVPLRSRIGNALTSRLFAQLTGSSLSDTQSGLRGIPRELIPRLLCLDGDRYEYEMNALAEAASSCGVVEVPIRTIYFDGNRSSHFRPFRDSLRIYRALAHFV